MKALRLAVAELHRSERRLGHRLRSAAARHHAEQSVYHVAADLAGWSDDHVAALAGQGRRLGLRLSSSPRRVAGRRLQQLAGDALRRRPEPALLLLVDLRHLHRIAVGASLDWELVAQAAQAARDEELLAVSRRCHPQTLRQLRWANAMVKELSPQTLTG